MNTEFIKFFNPKKIGFQQNEINSDNFSVTNLRFHVSLSCSLLANV